MATSSQAYPARLSIDYPESLDRATTFFRVFMAIPIVIILSLLTATGNDTVSNQAGGEMRQSSGGGIAAGIGFATLLMLLFRQKYPRWWFDFLREVNRFGFRVGAYVALLTDRYPSTDEEQSVHLEIDYPDASTLNRFMPLIKWLLAIPHYVVLLLLVLCSFVAVVLAWFAILFTGRYPRGLFDFVVGTMRWGIRVNAYAFLLVTDRYPPFSMT
jgi:hypothetical protein